MSNKELWEQQLNKTEADIVNKTSLSQQMFKAMSGESFYIGYGDNQFKIRTDGLGYFKIRTA